MSRQQLIEALDEVERLAKGAGGPVDGGQWRASRGELLNGPYMLLAFHQAGSLGSWALDHIARWDPATVLRLVERDRKMLRLRDRWQEISDDPANEGWMSIAADATVEAVDQMIELAAAFWLGTPEADS
jgi:hypothetical protein